MEILRLNIDQTEKPPTMSEVRLQVALLAAMWAIAASLVARFVFDAPLVPELLAQFIFAVAPIWVVEAAVGMLGPFAKHLAFVACVAVYLIALISAAIAYLRFVPAQLPTFARRISIVVFAFALWAITLFVVIPILGGGLAGRYLRQGVWFTSISLLIVYAVYGVALQLTSKFYIEKPITADGKNNLISRRRIVRGVGYAVLAVSESDIAWSLFNSWLNSGAGRVHDGDGVFPNVDNSLLKSREQRFL